jgi:hypothetical protein
MSGVISKKLKFKGDKPTLTFRISRCHRSKLVLVIVDLSMSSLLLLGLVPFELELLGDDPGHVAFPMTFGWSASDSGCDIIIRVIAITRTTRHAEC